MSAVSSSPTRRSGDAEIVWTVKEYHCHNDSPQSSHDRVAGSISSWRPITRGDSNKNLVSFSRETDLIPRSANRYHVIGNRHGTHHPGHGLLR